jgi:hypothetical protein
MRKWLVAILLALGLVAGVATASSAALRGTYRTTITGKPAALNGAWQLKFLPGGELRVIRNAKLVVVGKAVVTGNRVKVTDRSGPYACSSAEGAGVYTYKLAGTRLTFRPVADKCVGRKLILTTKPFVT